MLADLWFGLSGSCFALPFVPQGGSRTVWRGLETGFRVRFEDLIWEWFFDFCYSFRVNGLRWHGFLPNAII
jgi:hypothetical protein